MAQGKRISADIGSTTLQSIKEMGAAAKLARIQAGEGQAVAAVRLGVHVQTIARIESAVQRRHTNHELIHSDARGASSCCSGLCR